MKRVGFASISLVGSLWAMGAQAQQPVAPPPTAPAPAPAPPPPPPPGTAPAPGTEPAPGVAPAAGTAPAPAPAAPAPAPAAEPAPPSAPAATGSVSAAGDASLDDGLNGDAALELDGDQPKPAPTDYEKRWRKSSLQVQNAISGSTGLLHTSEAGSGAPGTFRMALSGSYFTSSGFLCNSVNVCPVFGNEAAAAADESNAMGAHLSLSATILPFLEAYLGFHNRAVSNTRSRPQLLQVLGDTNLGVKGFMPKTPDSIFSFGGELELWLLNGTGGVGLDGGGTSFAIRALSTLDLNNRVNPEQNIPLRFHANVAYKLDNSAQVIDKLENTAPPEGRGARISRIERFGLGINRVDFMSLAFAGEFDHPIIRPFLEWSIDIPLNARQGYTCNQDDVKLAGEGCLGDHQGFAIAPSRLTIGTRVFPWADHGLALLGAFDIGTGATSEFVEEVSPEPPWNLWFGLAYAVDTVPPPPVIERVKDPAPPVARAAPRAYVTGVVTERGAQTPVAGAILRYDGRNLTGMVAGDDGTFRSADLEPGTYTLNVTAPGYRDGQCVATVPPPGGAAPAPAAATPAPAAPGAPDAPAPATPPAVATPGGVTAGANTGGNTVVNVICELEALPKVGSVVGAVSDGETGQPVTSARITVTDPLNRSLDLSADSNGGFSVGNVKPGTVKLSVEAAGYFTSAIDVQVESRKEVQARIVLNKRPAVPNVVLAGREVKLKKEVHFQHDSTDVLPDSLGLLEELAELFKNKPEIRLAEVQGHTDNTGSAVYNQRLSQGRAQAVVDTLVRLGVSSDRLVAKGYGAEKPLVPNNTDANRAKNRRVQVMIQQK